MIALLLPLLMLGPEMSASVACTRPKNSAWIYPSDYPEEARNAKMAGKVAFTLEIDKQGCPTSCIVTTSSGYPLLDNATCRLMMKRVRIQPKLDENWKPIPAFFSKTVEWKL